MSYYTQQNIQQQQNSQQKSLGIFIVIALHVVLIWALANGLGAKIGKVIFPEAIQIKNIEQPTVEPQATKPVDLTEKPFETPPIFIPPTEFTPIDNGSTLKGTTPEQIIQPTYSPFTKASIKRAPKPDYPSAAARLLEEGTTGMNLLITADGRVANAEVTQSSGSARLDEAAVKHAMRNWVFTPCTENGKAVSCEQNMRLKWQLEDAKR